MRSNFFQSKLDGEDLIYANIRDGEGYFEDAKKYIEELWDNYKDNALDEVDDLIQGQIDLTPKFWEIYLGNVLLNFFMDVKKIKGKGYKPSPDFTCLVNGKFIHIEAVCANKGITEDAVPELPMDGIAHNVPINEMLLRLSTVFDKKSKNWSKYLSNINVNENDAYIIAINARNTHVSSGMEELPNIAKVLFDIGYLSVPFDGRKPFYNPLGGLTRSNGEIIKVGYFNNPEHQHVSGVLCSNVNTCNWHKHYIGDDFTYFHNPYAKTKVPIDMFRFCTQYISNDKGNGMAELKVILPNQ